MSAFEVTLQTRCEVSCWKQIQLCSPVQ